MTLNGKVALVTGGARRIGRAIALRLAESGMDIALTYRSSAEDARALIGRIQIYLNFLLHMKS